MASAARPLATTPLGGAAESALPTRRSYADFATEREAENHELRAETYEQGQQIDPHPHAFTPKTQADSAVDGIDPIPPEDEPIFIYD